MQQAFEELTHKIFDTPDLVSAGRPTPGSISLGGPAPAGDQGGACGAC